MFSKTILSVLTLLIASNVYAFRYPVEVRLGTANGPKMFLTGSQYSTERQLSDVTLQSGSDAYSIAFALAKNVQGVMVTSDKDFVKGIGQRLCKDLGLSLSQKGKPRDFKYTGAQPGIQYANGGTVIVEKQGKTLVARIIKSSAQSISLIMCDEPNYKPLFKVVD